MPPEVRDEVRPVAAQVREIYLDPCTTDDSTTDTRPCDVDGVMSDLCKEREFSEERVRAALRRAFPEA